MDPSYNKIEQGVDVPPVVNIPASIDGAFSNEEYDNIYTDDETTERILREIRNLTTIPSSFIDSDTHVARPPPISNATSRGYPLQYDNDYYDAWSDPGATPPAEYNISNAPISDCTSAFKQLTEVNKDTYDAVVDIHSIVMRAEYSQVDNASMLTSMITRLDAIEQRQETLMSTLNNLKTHVELLIQLQGHTPHDNMHGEVRPWDGSPQ